MHIFVQTLIGKILELEVESHYTIENVKLRISERTIVTDEALFFEEKELEDGRTLEDYHVVTGSTLQLVLSRPLEQ